MTRQSLASLLSIRHRIAALVTGCMLMTALSIGLKLVIALPTVFFIFSQILRVGLKTRTKKELMGRPELMGVFASLGERSTREFRWEFFIDSAILSMANGLILVFELGRIEFGVAILVAGVAFSLAGLVGTEAESSSSVGFLMLALGVIFVSELVYFVAFGSQINVLGINVLPRHIFLAPSLIILVLIVLAVVSQSKRKK